MLIVLKSTQLCNLLTNHTNHLTEHEGAKEGDWGIPTSFLRSRIPLDRIPKVQCLRIYGHDMDNHH